MEICKVFYYRVLGGDNLSEICQKFNTCQENVLRNNKEIPLYPGEWIRVEVNDFLTHYVKPAETLAAIAENYSMSKEKLMLDNNLSSEKLFIGQQLKIKKA